MYLIYLMIRKQDQLKEIAKNLWTKSTSAVTSAVELEQQRLASGRPAPSVAPVVNDEVASTVSTTIKTTAPKMNHPNGPSESDYSESGGNQVLGQIIGDDVIGNFDQIIIDQDQDGAIIVTKKKKEKVLSSLSSFYILKDQLRLLFFLFENFVKSSLLMLNLAVCSNELHQVRIDSSVDYCV